MVNSTTSFPLLSNLPLQSPFDNRNEHKRVASELRGHASLHLIDWVDTPLRLTGIVLDAGHLVQVAGHDKLLQPASIALLAELILALYEHPHAPFVSADDGKYCHRTSASLRQLVKRTRADLGSARLR
ncbi:hypothetical protein [Lacipirellula sp.]|uniref:hypothetical protein n=1 Tax=Lacipirellula sp. TaxID=2691419 RepID=UPI003D131520